MPTAPGNLVTDTPASATAAGTLVSDTPASPSAAGTLVSDSPAGASDVGSLSPVPSNLTVAEALAIATPIAGAAIDWSVNDLFKKTLTAGVGFSFSNYEIGDSIRIFLDRDATPWMASWLEGINWTGSSGQASAAPGYTEVILVCTNTGPPAFDGSYVLRADDTPVTGIAPRPAGPPSDLVSGTPQTPSAPGDIVT